MMCDYPDGLQACSTAIYVDPTWPQTILAVVVLFAAGLALMLLIGWLGELWQRRFGRWPGDA